MNQTQQLIDRRVSLRRYADRPIEESEVDAILHSAMRAPTAGNMMLYSILRVDDSEKRRALAETCGHGFIAEAPLVLVFLADMQRWVDFFEANEVREHCAQERIEYQSPGTSELLMSCCDALLAAQNSVIAAESLGIGSCYVGDIMGHVEEHRGLLDLPPFAFPITLLCYGYYPERFERSRSERFDRRFVVHRDSYQQASKEDLEVMLSKIREKFAHVLEERGVNLAQLTYRGFMAGPAAIEERRSVGILLEDWLKQRFDAAEPHGCSRSADRRE